MQIGADPVRAEIMGEAGVQVRRLVPPDAFHTSLAAHCLSVYNDLLKARGAIIRTLVDGCRGCSG
jgi:hypothetical protein